MDENPITYNGQEIAVTGLSIRVPKAKNIQEFWNNLENGMESISFYHDEELLEAGIDPRLFQDPNYIKVGAILEEKEYFDAAFFGYTPREAELLDPQVRIFHECCWQALEDGGIDPGVYPGLIGVYAGAAQNLEWEARVLLSGKNDSFGDFAASRLTGIRYLCTRLSFNLNLKGPSITMQTACSTSLVAIHMACQALLSGECDAALAGGVAISPRNKTGYIYEDDMILSRDGHNRTFDAAATGTVFGEGAGVILLKTLEDALAHEDYIYAVIKSTAVNNDGNRKVGFTAPSVEAQVDMMRAAYHLAGIHPETIGYVEAHGTATRLGDPIEIEALKQAFNTREKGFCLIGSVKTNLGHLDTAAGAAGFIKTVLSLKNRAIPPSLSFEVPNPALNLIDSPFTVNTRLTRWERGDYPRRAAVNSLGMGGTNAHVVLEEAPEKEKSSLDSETRQYQLILLSAKTKNSLYMMMKNLAGFLGKNKEVNLVDVAYTLQTRRKKFKYRTSLVCRDVHEAMEALTTAENGKFREYYSENDDKKIIFMFPGQGIQYINMGLDLYQEEKIFRREMERCFEIIKPYIGFDIKDILYPTAQHSERASEEIDKVLVTPAVVFIVEYALSRLLMEWGIKPDALIGHSFGEYTAACLAGVFSLEDVLKTIAFRSMLMSQSPPGIMMSVPLPAHQLKPLLNEDISLAIDNGASCIVSGPKEAINAFEKEMKAKKYICQYVQISVACHSRAMNSIFDQFREKIKTLRLNTPQIPFISNVTGTWITDDEAVNPEYWANHLRETVRFAEGIKELVKMENPIFLEVGPGNVLSGIVFQYLNKKTGTGVINLLKHPHQDISDISFLVDKIGKLWLCGINPQWSSFYFQETRQCVHIPPYAFDKQRYWLEDIPWENPLLENKAHKKTHIRDWFYVTSWTPELQLKSSNKTGKTDHKYNWLIFLDDSDIGGHLCNNLQPYSINTVTVKTGQTFLKKEKNQYIINPRNDDHYDRLLNELKESGIIPQKIVHLWGVTGSCKDNTNGPALEEAQDRGFYSLIFLTRALVPHTGNNELEIIVVTDNMQKVTGDEIISPIKSTVLGPVLVIPQEQINMDCRSIDIYLANLKDGEKDGLIDRLVTDLLDASWEKITAYRNGRKWKPSYQHVQLDNDSGKWTLKEKGVYLITGGLGRVGLVLAKELAKSYQARLALVGRSPLPGRNEWQHWLSTHDEQDTTSFKIKKIRELEETGSQVLYFSADAAEIENMQQVKTRVEEKFGKINGIIHAAGGTRNKSIGLIRDLDRTRCETQFKAKINGLMVLDQLFKHEELDFFILTSSMTSFLGGWEYAAYTAANFFLDNFVQANSRWICINLDPLNLEPGKSAPGGITDKELIQIFKTILTNVKTGQVLISLSDIQSRIEKAIRPLKDIQTAGEFHHQEKKAPTLFPRPDLTTPYVPPANEVETGLVEIWQQLFGYEKIGIKDKFFELGGNSLSIMKLISQIHKKFHTKLEIQDVFAKENVHELAAYIKEAKKETYFNIEPTEKKECYVPSPAQKRLFILQQMNPPSTGYNLPRIIDLEGDIDKEKMEIAFKKLIQRQESLRTSFEIVNEKPVQRIHDMDEIDFKIEYSEIGSEYRHGRKEPVLASKIDHFVRAFDLGNAPLLRIGLVKTRDKSVLLIDTHHIISDHVSENILFEEYNTLLNGLPLPDLRLQYKDYAQWQNNNIQQEQVRKEEEYWLKEFPGDIPVLNLPTDYSRPTFRSFAGNIVGYMLSETETREIKNFAKSNNATLYMALLSIYFILLYKISGDEDIIVGTPITSRRHPDLERIVGMFINTLPIRGYSRGNQLFNTFFYQIKNKVLEVFENQQFQFENLVEKVAVGRDVSRSPLFDVMFNLLPPAESEHQSLINAEEGTGVHIKGTSKFDMSWYAIDGNDTIYFNIEYCSHLFKPQTIDRFFRYFRTLLAGLSIDTDRQIYAMEILSPGEKKQVVNEFNDTRTDHRADKLLEHLFEEQVEKTPHLSAAVHHQQTLTYGKLNARASQLAKLLRKKGAAPGTIAAIEIERSLEMLIAILAILKAGSAFLPLDTLYPDGIKHYMKKDSSVPAVLVRELPRGTPCRASTALPPANIINIIILSNTPSPRERTNPTPTHGNRANEPACIIYTPGTAGKPKGVIIEHRNLLTFLDAMYRTMEIKPGHIIISQASCSSPTCLEEVFVMLLKGGKIAVPGSEEITDIHLLAKFLIKHNVNIISCSPQRLKELKQITRETPLQIIISSGDVLTGEHTDKLLKSGKVLNRYGSTETTMGAACFSLGFPGHEPIARIPIGKPLFNYQAYILDNHNQLLPVGIPGELCISGAGVTRGYLNQPELTAEKFDHDLLDYHDYHDEKQKKQKLLRGVQGGGFLEKNPPGRRRQKIYKTGDQARWLPGGNIEFLGRIDHQIKIRGYRININEIENLLRKKEEIKETVVIARKDKNGEQYLCAYIVVEKPLNKIVLREFLLKFLPGYIFPSYFVELEKLPLTPGGKIDREALPAPGITGSDRYTPPSHYYEKKMVEIWSGILNIDKEIISLNDNFFDLGGNSLQVINMLTQIQEIFNVKIPVLNVFENATVSNISKYIFMQDTIDIKLYLVFNKDKPKKIFCFPPGIGYGLIYSELSMYFKDYTFYAFNFIKDDDIIKRYADVIIDAVDSQGPDTPIILMAYSQGGKTSFKVIEKLESLGRHVSDIILFDCVIPVDYQDPLINKFEMNLEVGAKILESLLNEAGMGYMSEKVQYHRQEYLKFHISLSNFKPVNTNIHLIASQERDKILEKFSGSRLIGLDRLTTKTYKVYKGFGTHNLMLGGEYLHKNIKLLKNILSELH